MDRVEALGLGLAQVHAAHGTNPETGRFDALDDRAGELLLDGVGLDDRECTFHILLIIPRARPLAPTVPLELGPVTISPSRRGKWDLPPLFPSRRRKWDLSPWQIAEQPH